MGMAASQARLLMITSRLHDVELRAQQLQNAKLLLATQEDEAYEEYQKALDATTFTANMINTATGEESLTAMTFNSLFSMAGAAGDIRPSGSDPNQNYILIDKNGRVVVEDQFYEAYQNFQGSTSYNNLNNAYAFAFYMIEGERNAHQIYHDPLNSNHDKTGLQEAIGTVLNNHKSEIAEELQAVFDVYHANHPSHWPQQNDFDYYMDENNDGSSLFNHLVGYAMSEYHNTTLTNDEQQIYVEFLNHFWSQYGNEVYAYINEHGCTNLDGDDYDRQAFNYYVRMYSAIQQHGGCIAISDFDGPNGPAANNNEWLTAMLQSGLMTIETVRQNVNTGDITVSGTTVASASNLSYTATTTLDKTALAHAEAEYEHKLRVIDRKEQKIDRDLNKIETERNALTKQYDSIKKVSDDNIDRTFGIFS